MAGRVRLGARGILRVRGRGTRLASATLVAMLAAAFAFSAPATAQDAPGDAPADVSTAPTDTPTGGSDTPDAGTSEGETEPAETPEAGTEEPEAPPPGSETPLDDTTEPAEGTPPTEGTDPAEPPPPAEECTAGAAGCEPAEEPACDAGATTAPVAMTGTPGAGCGEVVELEPEPTPPPPAPSPPTPPAPPAPQAAASAPAGTSIVLLISEAGPGPSAGPSLPELANGLAPDGGRLSTMISTVVLGGPDETGAPEAADEESRSATDHALALANSAESMASSQREGPCARLSSAGMAPLSDTCPSSQRESILTVGTQPLPAADRSIIPPAPPPPDTPLQRHRRTHPEAQSETERPAVAVAPATSTRDHGRRLSGGGAPGGSSAAAGLRIFAVSTSPLLLTAPVTFPTEPQPSVLPEGEPGVPPPASPG